VTPDPRVFVTAQAKLNLFLHVGNKRADGYHDLESLVAFAAMGDEIELAPDDGFSLSVSGPFSEDVPVGEGNLALRAARVLAELTNATSGVRIRLTKNIPVAAGLGGGSADAAAVLRGLVRLWSADLDSEMLQEIAAALGADVPVCLACAPAWMEGKGERVALVPQLPPVPVLLVNPRLPVPTAPVFSGLRKRRGIGLDCPVAPFPDASALVRYLRRMTNDLEAPARAIVPIIGDVLDELAALPGLSLARMSGSGASCYGLFESGNLIGAAGRLLAERHPEWWILATAFASGDSGNPLVIQ
jgi:4-diphosphocytidyl-2-C-methyl-D-erythritol kinase